MEREFVSYEEALELKQLGFDEPCLGRYDPLKVLVTISRPNNNSYYKGSVPSFISAPLYQQAFRWFREKHKLVSCIRTNFNVDFYYEIYIDHMNEMMSDYYKTYEESELECLKELIQIVKSK